MRVSPVVRFAFAGLALLFLAAGIFFWLNRGSQVRLNASVIKVRTVSTSETTAVLIAEARLANPARIPFVVRESRAEVDVPGAAGVAGDPVAEPDLDHLLRYFKEVGPRYNPSLKLRSRLPGESTQDWTLAFSFQIPEAQLRQRRALRFEVHDVDGPVVRFSE